MLTKVRVCFLYKCESVLGSKGFTMRLIQIYILVVASNDVGIGDSRIVKERGVVLYVQNYSYNGTLGLNVILRDQSGELFPSSRRYKGRTFCHLTFSFDLRLNHFHRLFDRCHHLDHRFLVFSFKKLKFYYAPLLGHSCITIRSVYTSFGTN